MQPCRLLAVLAEAETLIVPRRRAWRPEYAEALKARKPSHASVITMVAWALGRSFRSSDAIANWPSCASCYSAKNGGREAVVLEGEAGIGKTRLIDEF